MSPIDLRLVRRALPLLVGLVAAPALAADPPADPRRVELVDGRVYVGEVVTTEASGIRLRIPQGETIVGFHLLRKLSATDASAWSGQRAWEVVVLGPDEERRWVEQALRTVPELYVAGDEGIAQPLPPGPIREVRACAPTDLACGLTAARRDDAWTWVITVEPGEGGTRLRGAPAIGDTSAGEAITVQVDNLYDPAALLAGLDEILVLDNVEGREAAVARLTAVAGDRARVAKSDKKDRSRKDREKKDKEPRPERGPVAISALDALVPVPGYPSLKAGDMTGFGTALAITVPVTAGFVLAGGSESTSAPEHIGLALGGYYATTVLVNHVLGARLNSGAVSVAPRPGGAQLGVRIRLP